MPTATDATLATRYRSGSPAAGVPAAVSPAQELAAQDLAAQQPTDEEPAARRQPARHDREEGGPVRLLLVDPDPLLREMLGAALALHDRRYQVRGVGDPASAFTALLGDDIDAIITEAVFPAFGERGFLARLRRIASHLPVLVLTAAPTVAARLVPDLDAILPKPPDVDYLLNRLTQLLDLQRTSIVRGFSLESFLQVLELERKTCTIDVEARGQRGRVWFLRGRLVAARTAHGEGREALYGMLAWNGAVLRLADGCAVTPQMDESVRAVLLEYCVRKDHAGL